MQSMLRARTRLRSDTAVTICVLEEVMETWMKNRGSRDLLSLLSDVRDATWKTAPRHEEFIQLHDLSSLLVDVCPSMCVSHTRLAKAIKVRHLEKICIFSPKPLDYEVTWISTQLRILLSKWREIYDKSQKREVCVAQDRCVHL